MDGKLCTSEIPCFQYEITEGTARICTMSREFTESIGPDAGAREAALDAV
jgi:hypothetical protein